MFENQKILVVGGAGFVGSNLCKLILDSSPSASVDVIDNLLSSEKSNLPNDSRLNFIHGSITNDEILNNLKDEYEYIFHLATFHGNQSSIHDPLKDHENNTLTTLKLFNTVRDFKTLKKVVYSSAGCAVAKKTFDTAEETSEDAAIELKQDSPYSISKIIGEFYSTYYFNQYELPVVRARFQNVYGPGEVLGAGDWRGTPATVWRNVTPTFIYKAIKKNRLPLQNEGNASRDFIFVTDICRGLIACALDGKPGDVYNLASGVETTIRELAEKINEYSQNEQGVDLLPKRPWDNSGKRFGNPAKAKEVLGFEAEVSLTEGLKQTIDWTLENLTHIEACMKKHEAHMKTN
ncbi:MAG: NAD-dependent epimerase/dehydratase family protein [Flavobacteriales bacterium]|nr:NAD-dependent epimerase/dehydratase family protein [Flavobacteriales bacterium]